MKIFLMDRDEEEVSNDVSRPPHQDIVGQRPTCTVIDHSVAVWFILLGGAVPQPGAPHPGAVPREAARRGDPGDPKDPRKVSIDVTFIVAFFFSSKRFLPAVLVIFCAKRKHF